jgi:hypothetical protein
MSRDAQQEAWLDSLGPMSPSIREIVATAVSDGDWMLWSWDRWQLTLRRYDLTTAHPYAYEEVVIARSQGRFVGARRHRANPAGQARRLDDLRSWITTDEPERGR